MHIAIIIYNSNDDDDKSNNNEIISAIKSTHNLGRNIVDKSKKLSNILWNILQLTFCNFVAQRSKFAFWVSPINSKHFMDFLEIYHFPEILSLKSFDNL